MGDDGRRYTLQSFNPRTGGPLRNGSIRELTATGRVALGAPPVSDGGDWVALERAR